MTLSDQERRFIDRRARFTRAWPMVAGVLLCLVLGLAIWLVVFNPLLANPYVVLSRLGDDAIPPSTLVVIHWSLGLHAVVITALIGGVFMLAYHVTRSLPPIMLAHFAVNFIDFAGVIPQSIFKFST